MKKEEGPIKKLCIYGYEYTLVTVNRGENQGIAQPCFMGHIGFALQSVKKLKNTKHEKN
jgi:hypothetical protein